MEPKINKCKKSEIININEIKNEFKENKRKLDELLLEDNTIINENKIEYFLILFISTKKIKSINLDNYVKTIIDNYYDKYTILSHTNSSDININKDEIITNDLDKKIIESAKNIVNINPILSDIIKTVPKYILIYLELKQLKKIILIILIKLLMIIIIL